MCNCLKKTENSRVTLASNTRSARVGFQNNYFNPACLNKQSFYPRVNVKINYYVAGGA